MTWGHCFGCGGVEQRKDSRRYLCRRCITQVANKLGRRVTEDEAIKYIVQVRSQ